MTRQGRSHELGFLEPRAAVPQAEGPAPTRVLLRRHPESTATPGRAAESIPSARFFFQTRPRLNCVNLEGTWTHDQPPLYKR